MSGGPSLLSADQALETTAEAYGDCAPAEVDLREIAHLSVDHVETRHRQIVPLAKDRWSIGRASYNDLILEHRSISAEHAVIVRNCDGYRIDDLSSRNGTIVNGNAVDRAPLRDGDRIEMGVYEIACHLPGQQALARPSRRAPVVLEFLTGGMRGIHQRFTQSTNEVMVGADTLLLARRESGWTLTHLSGDASLQVDGRRVGDNGCVLRHASEIELGKTRIRFRHL
ncbi:MAG: FHA domain-containing protein [Burkholderiaceae bacterium]